MSLRRKYVVLDQNVISDPTVVGPLLAAHRRIGQRIVLSTMARFEMTKGGLEGFLTDISELAKRPDAVFIGLPTMTLGREEIRKGGRVREIYDKPSTRNFRLLLEMITKGSITRPDLEAGIADEGEAAARPLRDVDWDVFYVGTADRLAASASEEETRRVRAGIDRKPPDREPLREALAETFGDRARLAELLKGVRAVSHAADLLVSFPSVIALDFMAHVSIAYYWSVKGDTRKRRLTQMVNEGIDVEGAVLAFYAEQFATNDGRAQGLLGDLHFFARRLWPT